MGKLLAQYLFAIMATVLISTLPTHAGVVGIDGQNKDALSLKIESLYTFLIAEGKIPVQAYEVERGDDVQTILRRLSSFKGAFFPQTLDALACDLNPQSCEREITTYYTSGGVITLSNLLQVLPSKGNWSRLSPGQTIIVPQITISENIIPRAVQMHPSQSVSDILHKSEFCQTDRDRCEKLFKYFNYNQPTSDLEQNGGTIFVPAIDYIVDIPTGCSDLCAIVNAPLTVDASRRRFAAPPFTVVTEQSADFLQRSGISPSVPQVANDMPRDLDLNKSVEATNNLSVLPSIVPDETLNKLNQGKSIVIDRAWKPIENFQPFTDPATGDAGAERPFNDKQQTLMTVSQYEQYLKILAQIKTKQSVMVIDSQFDRNHCEFAERRFVVYDCTNKGDKFSNFCPTDEGDTAAKMSDPVAIKVATSSGPIPQPAAEGISQNGREKCGEAGNMVEENDPQTEQFVAERHGTHLAGLIAARWDDNWGVGGINPSAAIVAVKVDMAHITKESYGVWLLARIKDIIYDNSVRVVDISAGYVPPTAGGTANDVVNHNDWLTTLIKDTSDHVLYVVAAGNSADPDCKTIPACLSGSYKNVVSVVALDGTGKKPLEDASKDRRFSLGADGENVLGPTPMNKYAFFSGSSQAAAIVAGASSLARGMGTGDFWKPSMTRNRLVACSDIQSADQLENMVGGSLDIDCMAKGETDLLELDDGTVQETTAVQIVANGVPQEFKFFDLDSGKDDHVAWTDVLGIQKIDGSDEYVIFIEQSTTSIPSGFVRVRASLGSPQALRHKVGPSFKTTNLDTIRKYVRRTSEKG
ncbi:S8 family peptidase [Rhizobium leguminosarum]|uniref:S8 family peptidase n=1 Tax=Rhizobium leguminosarum TaxID=384 RepID=UPI00143F9169|nr:S8 family serine peptidase [Rhizobium leguminosarum]NKL21560.1 S8 family serine peptidase [Rhizobium leguminosarum bv. viciae]